MPICVDVQMFFATREGFRVLFERADKSKEWHTALYYFAEHVRSLSFGRINYKALYARLDSSRVFVNHENSAVRKSSASILSRTIHSQRYIDALRASYNANPLVFKEVAAWLFEELRIDATIPEPQIAQYVQECLWPDVCTGLANEISGGRTGIGFGRVRREMNAFIASVSASCASYSEKFVSVISAILKLMTFGKLDSSAMHALCEQTRPLPKITSDGDVGAVTCDQTLTGEQNAACEQSPTCEQIATCTQAQTSVKSSACAQTPALAQTRVALEPDVACLVRVCGLRYELPHILQYGVAFDLFSDVPKDLDPHSETPCSILDAWMVAGGGAAFFAWALYRL